MGRVSMQAKRQIYKEIEASLPRFDEWKMHPKSVPAPAGVYLEMLEQPLERYVDGLVSPEKDCIEYYLAGIKPHAVLGMRKMKREGVTRADMNRWLVGDSTQWGLLQTMFRIFAARMNYCPFCHGGPRYNGSSPHPKLSGSVCPHESLWAEQEMKEGES